MGVTPEQLERLKEPFPYKDVEWRAQSCGKNANGYWVVALAFIDNRAIMDRLDDELGAVNWQNSFTPVPGSEAFICGIGIHVCYEGDSGDKVSEWIWKYDGAAYAAASKGEDNVKGGFSGSMKRTAVQLGIGRYLYHLKAKFVPKENIVPAVDDQGKRLRAPGDEWKKADVYEGKGQNKKWIGACWWRPPALPDWALPENERSTPPPKPAPPKPKVDPPKVEDFTGRLPVVEKYNKELMDEYRQSIDLEHKDEGSEILKEMGEFSNRHNEDDALMLHVFFAEHMIKQAASFNIHQCKNCWQRLKDLELPNQIKGPMMEFVEQKGKSLV